MNATLPLSGRTALITGGTRNIGKGVALHLAKLGANVCINSRQKDADSEKTLALIAELNGKAFHFPANIADEDNVTQMVKQTVAQFGGVDIFVHSAGIRRVSSLLETSLKEWREVMGTNLDAAFLCSKAVVPHMKPNRGRLIYVSGVSAFRGSSHRAHVVASKAGLVGLARSLAIELGEQQITVNCIAPGPIDTVRAAETGNIPHHPYGMETMLGHKGEAHDIAAMVGFLASDDGKFITGQVMHVNGGMHFGHNFLNCLLQFRRCNMKVSRRVFSSALGILGTTPIWAQTAPPFPNRPIKIVPFGTAGGPIDTLARIYGEKLQQRWGQPVLIDAKPGASGIIAADFVAKAPADGYTVMMTLPLTHVNNAILQAKLPYDPVKSFTPLSMLATGGPMLVARANAPFNNIKEFVEYAKKKGSMSYGTWGTGSSAHLFGELLSQQSGGKLVHAAYKSEAAAHNDLFGELLDFAWANPSTARNQSQAGKLKVLGIAGTKRVSTMPNVATFSEQGYKGFDVDSWIGMYAPANLSAEIQNTWVTALREITMQPDIQARLVSFGFEPLGNTPAQFAEVFKADFPRVAELIKAAGVTAQ